MFSKLRLPTLDSAVFRSLLTTAQVVLGTVLALLIDPNFKTLVTEFVPQALPLVASATGIVSLLVNVLRTDVKNY